MKFTKGVLFVLIVEGAFVGGFYAGVSFRKMLTNKIATKLSKVFDERKN